MCVFVYFYSASRLHTHHGGKMIISVHINVNKMNVIFEAKNKAAATAEEKRKKNGLNGEI